MEERFQTLDKRGNPPETVIKDAPAAQGLAAQIMLDDQPRSYIRSVYKNLYDGGKPFDDDLLKKEGQQNRTNISMRRAKAITDSNVDSYWDARREVPRRADIKIQYGSTWESQEASEIVSQEFDTLIKRWTGYYSLCAKSDFNRVYYGAGPQFFENADTWRPKAAAFGDIYTGANASTDMEELPFFFGRKEYYVGDLYQFIKDPEVAKKFGWNIKAVKKAIELAPNKTNKRYNNWESLEQDLKNNSLYLGYVDNYTVPVIQIHVKEFDGKISRKLICEWKDIDEYLCEPTGQYKKFYDFINPYFLNQSECQWHGIRGLGSQFFSVLRMLDIIGCQLCDLTCIASSLVLIPKTEGDLRKLMAVQLGPVTVLPPGITVQQTQFPNLQTGGMVTHQMLLETLHNTTGSYAQRATTPSGQARTAAEIQSEIANAAKLSMSQQTQFYTQEDIMLHQMYKRAMNFNIRKDLEYGQEAERFQKRILARGVPKAALALCYLDSVAAVRASGAGSPAMRMMLGGQKMQALGLITDPTRLEMAKREAWADQFGYDSAARYFPIQQPLTSQQDYADAEKESALMKMGSKLNVFPYQNAVIHLTVHIPPLFAAHQAVQQGQGDLQQAYQEYATTMPHIQAHLAGIAFDPSQKSAVKEFNQAFAQLMRNAQQIEQQLGDQVQAQQEEQMRQVEEQQKALQQAENEPDPVKLMKLQLDFQKFNEKKFVDRSRLALDASKQAQEMAETDFKTSRGVKPEKNGNNAAKA